MNCSQCEPVDDIAAGALFAPGQSQLVAAAHTDQQVPGPFDVQRGFRDQRSVGLERLAEAMTETHIALELRLRAAVAAEQAIRDQRMGNDAGFEGSFGISDQRADLRR